MNKMKAVSPHSLTGDLGWHLRDAYSDTISELDRYNFIFIFAIAVSHRFGPLQSQNNYSVINSNFTMSTIKKLLVIIRLKQQLDQFALVMCGVTQDHTKANIVTTKVLIIIIII